MVASLNYPNNTVQTGAEYKNAIDGFASIAGRFAAWFAPQGQSSPDMTVMVNTGYMWNAASAQLTEVAAQNTPSFTAPSLLPRIDRIVADQTSGAISVVKGTESSSAVAPAIPGGKFPIARVTLQTTTSAISDAMITDERAIGGAGSGGGGFGSVKSIASAATCDIGSVSSNYVFITGTSGITSFGSSANVTSPVYLVQFAGAIVLTNSGSLQLPTAANVSVAANDYLLAVYQGSGVWQVPSIFSSKFGTNAMGNRTISSSAPSGGSNGDIWLQV